MRTSMLQLNYRLIMNTLFPNPSRGPVKPGRGGVTARVAVWLFLSGLLLLPNLQAEEPTTLDFTAAGTGIFTSLEEDGYVLTWIGFGDKQTVADVGGANGNVLRDSAVNSFGAEVVIHRKDGRGFYFESLEASGVAVGADAIRVTYASGSGNGDVIQVIAPRTQGFASYASSEPGRLVRQLRLNIVSTSTSMAVDNIRLHAASSAALDFDSLALGTFTSAADDAYVLGWIGFGDLPEIANSGNAHGRIFKDSNVNGLGAEIVIARKDRRSFYFESLEASGVAVGADAIRVTFVNGNGTPDEIQVIKPTSGDFKSYASVAPRQAVRQVRINIVSTSTDMAVDNVRLSVAPIETIDLETAPVGEFSSVDDGCFVLGWIGFGDKQTVSDSGTANGNVLKDSGLNQFGAEVVIARRDGRAFYFESLDAAGIAVGADAIRVTYPADGTNPEEVQVIKPTTAGFGTYTASSPGRMLTQLRLNIVSVSTDMRVDNIRFRLPTETALDFSSVPEGVATSFDQQEYLLRWVGFGDKPEVQDVGGANGKVFKDSAINAFGAEIIIARRDGRAFYFESFDAAGIAAGADAIRITYPADSANAESVQVIRPTSADFTEYASSLPGRAVRQLRVNIVSTSADMAVDNLRLRLAPFEVIDFSPAPTGVFTTAEDNCFVLRWIGFGDKLELSDLGGAHGNVLKDSAVNVFGAEAVIFHKDGRAFYFESLEAAGVAAGSDAIRITYPTSFGNPEAVQVVRPTTTDFATYASVSPGRLLTNFRLNIVSTSTDMAVDNIRVRLAPIRPLITGLKQTSDQVLRIVCEGENRSDVVYQLETATRVAPDADWSAGPNAIALDNGRFEFWVNKLAGARFFRVVATLAP